MESRRSAGAPRGRGPSQRSLKLAVIGTAAGFFSGLFGVGGGTVMVPLLVLWLAYEERPATGTSLAAIIAIASFAAGVQALYGNVKVVDGLLVGIPAAGRRAGRHLAAAAPAPADDRPAVRRGADRHRRATGVAVIVGALLVGLLGGVIAGLLGVGGGVVFVPGMVLFLGPRPASCGGHVPAGDHSRGDLGTIRQDRYGNVNRHDAVRLGLLSIGGAAAGVALANALPGQVLRDLFAAFMVFVAVRLVRDEPPRLDSVGRWDSTTRFTSRSWS